MNLSQTPPFVDFLISSIKRSDVTYITAVNWFGPTWSFKITDVDRFSQYLIQNNYSNFLTLMSKYYEYTREDCVFIVTKQKFEVDECVPMDIEEQNPSLKKFKFGSDKESPWGFRG